MGGKLVFLGNLSKKDATKLNVKDILLQELIEIWADFNYRDSPLISEENWMKHFQSLHSNDPLNSDQQNLIYELRKQEDNKMQSHPLDFFITEAEIRTAVKKLKNNKSPYSDKIRNEMIKTSLNEMILKNVRCVARHVKNW